LSLVERVRHDSSASCRLLQCFATSEIPRRKVNTLTVSPLYLDRCNDELAQASHWEDLPESNRLFLWLDVFQDGIGTRSCGPDARPEFAGRMRECELRCVIAQVGDGCN